jgi:hypothetical protein
VWLAYVRVGALGLGAGNENDDRTCGAARGAVITLSCGWIVPDRVGTDGVFP